MSPGCGRVPVQELDDGDSAADDEQWWAAHAPLLGKVLDPAAYPLAVASELPQVPPIELPTALSTPMTSACRSSSAASLHSSTPTAQMAVLARTADTTEASADGRNAFLPSGIMGA
jgi:hypothetical protein